MRHSNSQALTVKADRHCGSFQEEEKTVAPKLLTQSVSSTSWYEYRSNYRISTLPCCRLQGMPWMGNISVILPSFHCEASRLALSLEEPFSGLDGCKDIFPSAVPCRCQQTPTFCFSDLTFRMSRPSHSSGVRTHWKGKQVRRHEEEEPCLLWKKDGSTTSSLQRKHPGRLCR